MFRCDSNFIETKDLTLASVVKRDAITFTLFLLKGCEYHSLPRHMICASTIKHPTCTTRRVSLQNKLDFYFRYPSLIGSSQVSDKALDASITSKTFVTSTRIGGYVANSTNTTDSSTFEFGLSSLATASDEQ
jgi:hypothetical protein